MSDHSQFLAEQLRAEADRQGPAENEHGYGHNDDQDSRQDRSYYDEHDPGTTDDGYPPQDDDQDDSDSPARSRAGSARRARGRRVKAADRFDSLQRIESRLRLSQVRGLSSLTLNLMARRSAKGGQRITNNTLIRVAVAGLLEVKGEIHGDNEEELRASFLQLLQSRNG